jgi:hypothetical protein
VADFWLLVTILWLEVIWVNLVEVTFEGEPETGV